MAKAAKAAAPVAEAKPACAPKKTVSVIYRPLKHPDGSYDPPAVKWNGVAFEANVPVELDPKRVVMVPRTRMVEIAGTMRPNEYEEAVSMIELAKGNPSFEVEGFRRAKQVIPTMLDDKGNRVRAKLPPPGAEWAGTNRAELVPADEVEYPDDFDPTAAAIVITREKQVA